MIDENKLIDALRPYYDKVLHQNITDEEKIAKHDMLSDVMVEIRGQLKVGEWVLCSDKLPIGEEYKKIIEDEIYYKYVLTYVDEQIPYYIAWYDQEYGTWYDTMGFPFDPIAWQQLPEAYQLNNN